MNISYNWLKELIDLDLSPEDTAKALTRVGLAVEGIHPHKDDLVLDIDLTSNRPDCLSHLGIARELSVVTRSALKVSGATSNKVPEAVVGDDIVTIQDTDRCHRFTARVIRGVKVGPSPQWLVDRLEALGERSINNIADITNYVMLELGQPMHAFDLNKLTENRIVIRTAKPGEKIKTLDEVDRKLDETMLAICDAEKPVAVAGVMGGIESGITDDTTNVLLEVAYFKRENIRLTSRKLGLASEASYRFERGVDIENLIRASDRATELILDLAGGEAADIVDVYPERQPKRTVPSADISSAVKRLTGLDVATDECERILSSLGIARIGNGEFSSPTWRHDIAIEEDLVEEVARHAGYEKITLELPPVFAAGEYQPNEQSEKKIRSLLQSYGFLEAISYSFIDTSWDEHVDPLWSLQNGASPGFVTLKDSVIDGALRMRPSCVPGLLDSARHNLNHQIRDIKLFEIGKVFIDAAEESGLPIEKKYLTLLMTGGNLLESTDKPIGNIDFFDIKGMVESLSDLVGVSKIEFSHAEARQYRRGQCAALHSEKKLIGIVGRLSDGPAKTYKFRKPVYLAEIDLDAFFQQSGELPLYRPLNTLPISHRDITFVVDPKVEFGTLHKALLENRSVNCVNIGFYDEYRPEVSTARSITFRFSFLSSHSTLTDSEIDEELRTMVSAITAKFEPMVDVQG
ncbi:MAG: phenylalanine--tRNA ligase subunit beta [Acidobacteriota bacterium]|nr:MAG: phenylalanine--tRNA ligase subunit beta [Acidobacteriota bacterium]